MAELKLYEYEVGGVKHTAQMTAEDAKRYNGKPAKGGATPSTKAAPAPENKAG